MSNQVPSRETLEDPAHNAKRQALEVELQNAILKMLDHMGWPGGFIIPLNTLQIEIKITTNKGATNAN